jgi:hypothetical protein
MERGAGVYSEFLKSEEAPEREHRA